MGLDGRLTEGGKLDYGRMRMEQKKKGGGDGFPGCERARCED